MTPRSAINFFRSRTGAFLLFLLLLGIGYVFVNGWKAPDMSTLVKPIVKGPEKSDRKSQVVETVTRDMTAFNPPKETPTPATPAPVAERKKQTEY